MKDYVLCRIFKKKPSKGAGKRRNTNDENDQDQMESIKTGDAGGLVVYGNYYGMEVEPPTGDMTGFQGTLNHEGGVRERPSFTMAQSSSLLD
ncbi:hypothetical protein Q3G72_004872 [Acer saccharum]|nr:hypothetical protein Q3G72_004872 [Acer saccharum]